MEDDGVVMAVGRAVRKPSVIDFELAGTRSARGRIENFNVTTPFGPDLAHLVGLLAAGELDAQVGWRGPWDKASEAADALLARRVAGKTVLEV
ncbi:zinc-binding dehydrogenase [Nonomuraea bangladeshensis]